MLASAAPIPAEMLAFIAAPVDAATFFVVVSVVCTDSSAALVLLRPGSMPVVSTLIVAKSSATLSDITWFQTEI